MRKTFHARTAAAIATAVVVATTAATIVIATGAGVAAAAPRSTASHVVTATISRDGLVHLPRSVHPGYRHVRVTGAAGHALQLVIARTDASVARLVADYRDFSRTGLPVRPERDFIYVGGALTGGSTYLRLVRGTYFAFDASGSTLTAAGVRTLSVRGDQRSSERPRLTATITAIGSDEWAPRPTSIAHEGYLKFINASRETQFVNLLQLQPHTTLAELEAVLADPDADPSTVTTGLYDETGVVSRGRSEISSYSLPAGEYALISLWPDDTTGQPHAAEGMVRLITLT